MMKTRSAFSLLELMIVVLVMSGITAIVWPNLTKKLKSSNQIIFQQKLKETIEYCRYNAIIKGKIHMIIVQEKKINALTLDNVGLDGIIEKQVIWINANGEVYEK